MALAALVAALALGGCGGGDGDDADTTTAAGGQTTTSTQTATTTSTEAGPKTGSGAGDEVKTKSGTATIGQAVQAVLGTSNGQACSGEFATQHYLQVAYGGREGCLKAQSPQSAAKRVHAPTVGPTNANELMITTVEPEGGLYDGEKLTVTVVREGGGWKVDAIESNAPVGP